MTDYHAVMLDETGQGEFGVSFKAETREDAWDFLAEMYPESTCIQLEDPDDRAKREKAMYDRIQREMDGDYTYDEEYY